VLIGLAQVSVYIHSITSLKEKRRILTPIFSRLRNNFNVVIAEEAADNNIRKSWLYIVCINTKRANINSMLQKIIKKIKTLNKDLEVLDYHINIF